jgi:hypothetical protein
MCAAILSEFQQFHRAFVISTNYINYIEGATVRLSNNLQFNVGGKYKPVFDKFLDDQLLKQTEVETNAIKMANKL